MSEPGGFFGGFRRALGLGGTLTKSDLQKAGHPSAARSAGSMSPISPALTLAANAGANPYSYSYGTTLSVPVNQIRGVGPDAWFGPQQPLAPFAPPNVAGRQFDYPFGANLQYIPRGDSGVSFAMLRNLADNLPELRTVIEKRKDQIEAWEWDIQKVLTGKEKAKAKRRPGSANDDPRIDKVKDFLRRPDKRYPFATWLRMILEDMLVIDAATLYPRKTYGGDLFSLDVVDGATIKPLIGLDGRQPLPEDGPAFQQVLHGVPAADFSLDELMYLPRNPRSNKIYGYSPVETVILTVTIALRRNLFNLNYYQEGTLPDGFATLPKEWTQEQIASFQSYFDSLMAGNDAQRRKVRMMPDTFQWVEVRQPPMKDNYDEWLMRIICAAFSIPPSPFVADGGRATAQTVLLTASQEGIRPLKKWIKSFMDRVIQDLMGFRDLEYVWSGEDEIDPLEKAQELQIYVASGIMTRDEAREEIGREELGVGATTDVPVYPLVEGYHASVDNILNPDPEMLPGSSNTGTPAGAAKPRPKGPNVDETASSPKTKKAPAHKDPTKGRRYNRKIAKIADEHLEVESSTPEPATT